MPNLRDNASARTTSTGTTSLTTAVTPFAGDIIVVKAVTGDSATSLNAPTDTQGNAYTLRASAVFASGAGRCDCYLWTATAGSGVANTVTHNRAGSGAQYSATTEVWQNADLASTPANYGGSGSGAPSGSLVTTQNNSAVTWCCGDWAANSTAGRTYNGSPVEEFIDDQSAATVYSAYYAYQSAASPGTQTVGITAPSVQTWSMVAMEVLDIPTGTPGEDPDQYDRQPWH